MTFINFIITGYPPSPLSFTTYASARIRLGFKNFKEFSIFSKHGPNYPSKGVLGEE
jgi:hypothetical protein